VRIPGGGERSGGRYLIGRAPSTAPSSGVRRLELPRAWLVPGVAALSLAGLACAVHVGNALTVDDPAFDFSHEWSVPTILTGAIFLAAGIVAGVAGARRQVERRAWLVIAAVSIAFSAEELGLQLHERLEDVISVEVTLLLLAVVGVALVAWSWRWMLGLAPPTPPLLIAAILVLGASQVAGLVATKVATSGQVHNLFVLLEEGGEASAGALVLAAAWIAAAAVGTPRSAAHEN
jgi:hypothetical protein